MANPVDILWRAPKHVLARHDNVIVQVRGAEHTVAALDAQHTGLQLARVQLRTRNIGALLIIEEGAPVTTGGVARRQREVVETFSGDEHVFVSVVLEGSGAGVALERTIARALFAPTIHAPVPPVSSPCRM